MCIIIIIIGSLQLAREEKNKKPPSVNHMAAGFFPALRLARGATAN